MQDRCIFNMIPFFSTYDTPHETVPFDKITINDFEPAIMKGIEEEDEVIDAIVNNPDTPTFENTIEALENSGELLSKVTEVFFNLLSAETTDEMYMRMLIRIRLLKSSRDCCKTAMIVL